MVQRTVSWIPAVERKMSVLFQDLLFLGTDPEHFIRCYDIDILYHSNRYVDGLVFLDPLDIAETGQAFTNAAKTNPDIFKDFAKTCREHCEKLEKKSKEIGSAEELKIKSRSELKQVWDWYTELVKCVMPSLPVALVAERLFEQIISARLMQELHLTGKDELQAHVQKLILPAKANYVADEMRDLLRIGCQVADTPGGQEALAQAASAEASASVLEQSAPELYSECLAHAREYGWMYIQGYLGNPMTTDDVVRRLANLATRDCRQELSERERRIEEQTRKFHEFAEQEELSDELRTDLEIASTYVYLRMYRWDALSVGHYHALGLFAELGRLMGLTSEEVTYLTAAEIERFLERGGPLDKRLANVARQRKAGYAYTYIDREVELVTGPQLATLKAGLGKPDYSGVRRLEGETASVGETRGAAKITRTVNDVGKVNLYDVVVSPMTTPDLMVALERASAIVTDEGGILCHAAIVSRELGLPCVIGTRIATRVLRDGDLVLVCAKPGIGYVEIVERRPD